MRPEVRASSRKSPTESALEPADELFDASSSPLSSAGAAIASSATSSSSAEFELIEQQ
jgi:hypothetical protein